MTAVSVLVSPTGESLLRKATKREVRDNSAREARFKLKRVAPKRKARSIRGQRGAVTKNVAVRDNYTFSKSMRSSTGSPCR
jgi:hypothetical protein